MKVVFNEGLSSEQSYDISICQEIQTSNTKNTFILDIKRVFIHTLIPVEQYFAEILDKNYYISTISIYKDNKLLMSFDNYHNIVQMDNLFSDIPGIHFDQIIDIQLEREEL